MKVTILKFEGSPEELDASKSLRDALDRYGIESGVLPGSFSQSTPLPPPTDVDVGLVITQFKPADSRTGGLPGVPAEGSATVQRLLTSNAAPELFIEFLAQTTSWPDVRVHGITPKGARRGTGTDYTRYLRLRRQGSHLGAFAYIWPIDGTVNLRLKQDNELASTFPVAKPVETGHREYRINVQIVDKETLQVALELARLAYDGT